jgi:hypothetical protein
MEALETRLEEIVQRSELGTLKLCLLNSVFPLLVPPVSLLQRASSENARLKICRHRVPGAQRSHSSTER